MSGYEKYVEQAAEASWNHNLPSNCSPWDRAEEVYKEGTRTSMRAALAAIGPLIEEDARDRMVTAAGRALERDPDVHVYLSTACLHGNHQHCQGTVNLQGEPKQPQECKWCSSPCICCCHQGATP